MLASTIVVPHAPLFAARRVHTCGGQSGRGAANYLGSAVKRPDLGTSASWEVASGTQISRSGAAEAGSLATQVADQNGGYLRACAGRCLLRAVTGFLARCRAKRRIGAGVVDCGVAGVGPPITQFCVLPVRAILGRADARRRVPR